MTTSNQNTTQKPSVVIIGGGFAGLSAARALRHAPVQVTLIDKRNYHLFQPLLYQVATATLSPADIAYPIRRVFHNQKNIEVIMGEVEAIDLHDRTVRFGKGEVHFDVLMVAGGATHSYFGQTDWEEAAPGLKTIDDALEIRRRMLLAFEEAEQEADEASRRAKLTFVVVGGGPTGVELAGALKEIASDSLPRDFRHIDTTTTRVILIEAGPRLLGAMPVELGERAQRDLEAMGVEVRVNAKVTSVTRLGVQIGDEELPAANVIWAAGVQASPLGKMLGGPMDRSGRVLVQADLSIPGQPNVFVAGDLASVTNPVTMKPVPGVAPAAIQMGRYVAKLIEREVTGKATAAERQPFVYVDKGTLATIGKARAVAWVAGRPFAGLFAWLLWSVIHVVYLIGFRNKVLVMLGWVWNYLMFSKGARLITGNPMVRVKRPRRPAEELVDYSV